MKAGKPQTIAKKIRDEIYDPGHRWKYDIWPLKLLALFFIIANFQWLNDPPISKLGLIAVTESLFLIYAILFFTLFKNKIKPANFSQGSFFARQFSIFSWVKFWVI